MIISIVGLPLIPPPSFTDIFPDVPVIVLVDIAPPEVLDNKPVVVRPAIATRSKSYGCADEPSTVPFNPYAASVVGFSAFIILPLASTVTLV